MAMRIHENCVVSGKVDNSQKGRVEVELVFTNGSRLRGAFAGNAHRDLAGRKLSFKHPALKLTKKWMSISGNSSCVVQIGSPTDTRS